ncbi:cysteine--tRNA ligase, partial [Buchnera aphidicola (Hormaphis cornu)]
MNMYVCGVTVDNLCHIGHARTFVVFDMIARYLKFYGYKLNYVRNITDIDDKIIKKIIFLKKDYSLFVNQMIKDMNLDFFNLNLLKPDKEPRATKHINVMIKFIENLLEQKYAYISNKGDIIFSVRTFSEYGQLSNQDITQLQSGNRVIVDVDKKNSKDFVLWKKSTTEFKSKDIENQFSWSSPWGEGRPGWHVECSAISALYLKDGIDIHGGGIDLVFPHHENENAQLCCFNKKKFVNYWMHSGLLLVDNKKMSKSLN